MTTAGAQRDFVTATMSVKAGTTSQALDVAHPTFPASLLVPVARRLEQRDPRKVVAALLDDH